MTTAKVACAQFQRDSAKKPPEKTVLRPELKPLHEIVFFHSWEKTQSLMKACHDIACPEIIPKEVPWASKFFGNFIVDSGIPLGDWGGIALGN